MIPFFFVLKSLFLHFVTLNSSRDELQTRRNLSPLNLDIFVRFWVLRNHRIFATHVFAHRIAFVIGFRTSFLLRFPSYGLNTHKLNQNHHRDPQAKRTGRGVVAFLNENFVSVASPISPFASFSNCDKSKLIQTTSLQICHVFDVSFNAAGLKSIVLVMFWQFCDFSNGNGLAFIS